MSLASDGASSGGEMEPQLGLAASARFHLLSFWIFLAKGDTYTGTNDFPFMSTKKPASSFPESTPAAPCDDIRLERKEVRVSISTQTETGSCSSGNVTLFSLVFHLLLAMTRGPNFEEGCGSCCNTRTVGDSLCPKGIIV